MASADGTVDPAADIVNAVKTLPRIIGASLATGCSCGAVARHPQHRGHERPHRFTTMAIIRKQAWLCGVALISLTQFLS